ncbi:cobalamin biosynthesis protein CobW [Streptomyces sp. NPDC002671]
MIRGQTRLPVAIVDGLYADARRAAVEEILRTVPGSVALHHDLTSAVDGSVHRTVRDADGLLGDGDAPLVNNCACCALREDLVPELLRLADDGGYRLALVKLWDSVEPQAMAGVIAAAGAPLALTGVATVVDPALVLPCLSNGDDLAEVGLAAAPTDQRTVSDTFARQLEYPTVIAPAEEDACGAGGEAADDTDHALLAQLTPGARKVRVEGDGALGATLLAGFDVAAAAARVHPACALLPQECDEHGVSTFVWRRERPFHSQRLLLLSGTWSPLSSRTQPGACWARSRSNSLVPSTSLTFTRPWTAGTTRAAGKLGPQHKTPAADQTLGLSSEERSSCGDV